MRAYAEVAGHSRGFSRHSDWPVDAPLLPAAARQEYDAKRAAWEAKTAADRAELEELIQQDLKYRDKQLMRLKDEVLDLEDFNESVALNAFTLDDFRDQRRTIRKMGALDQILGMLPGMGNLKALSENKPDEKQLGRIEAIISSMTPEERRKQHIINGSRRKRIAKGSGTSVEEVNRLLKQFVQMQKMMKTLGGIAGMGGGGKNARRKAFELLRNRR